MNELSLLLDTKGMSDESQYDCLSTEVIETLSTCTLLPAVLSAIRRALNNRRKVHSLPAEILVKIFSFIPAQSRDIIHGAVERCCGPFAIFNVWDLLPIAQVCYYWRSVALEVSPLWSSAFIVPRKGSVLHRINACYLSRCTAGPVDVYVEEDAEDHGSWRHSAVDGVLQEYGDHERELHVDTTDGWRGMKSLPDSLSHPLPALQHLTLRCWCTATETREVWAWRALQDLFGGCSLSKLQSLAILNAPFLPANTVLQLLA
ncbi:hypothetical protein K466DRAFT_138653 [Polyporus arcularius HHB13444]|uniref:F-box domain-containing protein n=1 Tax=Polyporus arcularius HHB13444 TaxID=1314778 RepID=A0A5C3PWZ3_9APHY|nr:hypothetical protein K466DRAFT_138653 [Polyporus arcularius HHB13444]